MFASLFRHLRSNSATRKSRLGRRPEKRRLAWRLELETLEDRVVPSAVSISVGDATINEIGGVSAFVASGSGGLSGPKDLTLGPDGNLYVASSGTSSVLRFSAVGQLLGTFVTANSGGLATPFGLAFGPDNNLYVGSEGTNAIYEYSGTTGTFVSTFVSAGSGGLNDPKGMVFGQDGNLYISSHASNSILRYQGPAGPAPGSPLPATGQSGALFVAAGSGGMANPKDLVFGPAGDLYVASGAPNHAVLRFDGATGIFNNTFVAPGAGGLGSPTGLAFDQDGRLYVADQNTNAVHRFDNQGQYLDDPVVSIASSLRVPVGIIFDVQGSLLISSRDSNEVARYDRGVVVTLSAASPSPVSVDYATADDSATSGDYSAQAGTVTFAPGETMRRVVFVTKDDVLVESNESFNVQLSNATGGTAIADGSAVVTIVDDDAPRLITITDTSAIEGDHSAHYRGAFVQSLPSFNFNDLTFGPDGKLYSAPGPADYGINRYDGATGAFIDQFVPAGRISGVRDIIFRDGYLYVGSEYTDEVLRFDATTGAFVDAFVTAGSGGIDGPHGLIFGPDSNGDNIPELYVTGRNSFNVVRYDGATGQPLGTFNTSGSGALLWPEGITAGPGGVIYVASTGTNQVQKYNALTGAYVGSVSNAALSGPKAVRFGPDGLMYVASSANNRILRFTASGTFVDDYVSPGSGGMVNCYRMEFGPDGDLYVTALGSNQILRFGTESEAIFTVSLSTASSSPVTVDFASVNGSAISGSDYLATVGTVTFNPGISSKSILVPILDDAASEPTETFSVNLSNAAGATITNAQGVATILDNETKFFVVNDGAPDQTFEYGSGGAAVENYVINSGNTAPRGAASTAVGTKVWVVDANKNVYVYNPSGGLLGSWSAGGMNAQAQVEGIATNGTDIWLVDNKQDKVFKYTGAASRLSGSQSAASSFGLNASNTNSKDIVTDGVYLWVVNDSTTDRVFKYTVAGSLVGSWTIDAANASPTGITIDPANVSDIWIVDNGTDKVYQYTAAAGRTSGSQSAAATFALAAGNTNPQGIADPPAPGTLLPPVAIPQNVSPTESRSRDSDLIDDAELDRIFAAGRPSVVDPFADGFVLDLLLNLQKQRAAGVERL